MAREPVTSAGLLVWRPGDDGPEFLLGRMGGPYWARKEAGAWSIPKGRVEPGEAPLAAAVREFGEETGLSVEGDFAPLPPRRLASGKRLLCWLVRGDPDLAGFTSNLFEMEWPPRSGLKVSFPEIERVAWFDLAQAGEAISPGQRGVLEDAALLIGG